VSIILLGVFCALNLFLAILLLPFDGSDMILLSNRVHPEGDESTREQPSLVRSKAITALKWLKDKFKLLFGLSLGRYDDYANVLRAYQANLVEINSPQRDEAAAFDDSHKYY
jgi:ABC-type dipeptide/oligopeptide/nickel transport system permease component